MAGRTRGSFPSTGHRKFVCPSGFQRIRNRTRGATGGGPLCRGMIGRQRPAYQALDRGARRYPETIHLRRRTRISGNEGRGPAEAGR